MSRRVKPPLASNDVEIPFEGKTYRGSYTVSTGKIIDMVNVQSSYGSKGTGLGHAPPKLVAERLLHELVTSYERKMKIPTRKTAKKGE